MLKSLRSLGAGVCAAVVAGVFAGVLDAWTTPHEYLDRSFLNVSIVAWLVLWIPAGIVLGALAGLWKQARREAIARRFVVGFVLVSIWFQTLVYVNVEYLASDSSREALLVDAASVVLALLIGLGALALLSRVGTLARFVESLARPLGAAVGSAGVWGLALLFWSGGSGTAGVPEEVPRDDAPNVILILIDTLRQDHLTGEGYDRPTSPALDEFASSGASFAKFHSQSCYTKPAVASMMTSLYPSAHRVSHLRTVLPSSRETLFEAFHEAGYRTGAFVSNPIIGPEFGFAQGAERFHMLPTEAIPKTKLGYALFRLTERGRDFGVFRFVRDTLRGIERALTDRLGADTLELTAAQILEAYTEWRGEIGDEPFFAYLHFMEPHAPYSPPRDVAELFWSDHEPMRPNHPPAAGLFLPFQKGTPLDEKDRRGIVRAYDAEIRGIDDVLGEFLNSLTSTERANTIVAVTSDHGEEFFEHDGWGHGHSLHEELLAVPFLIAGPGVSAGLRIEAGAQLIDVGPTLLELAGLDVGEDMIGRSQAEVLRDGSAAPPDTVDGEVVERGHFAEILYGESYWARSLREGQWKLIVSRLGEEEHVALFDLEMDPAEKIDRSEAEPERTQEMRDRIDLIVAVSSEGATADVTARFDPVEEERLRALGYVGQD